MSTYGAGPGRRAVLLDAAGTLVELQPPAPLLQRVLRERHGIAVSVDDAARAIRAEISYYRANMHEGRDRSSVDALRSRCAEQLRRALAPAAPDVGGLSASQMAEVLLASLVFRAFDDVTPALRALRAAGCAMVVVSNWDASLEERLVELGLRPLLHSVVSSGAFGVAKPDPAIFLGALRRVGIAPERALHVGDSLGEDVAGARAAGVEPVLLVRDGAEPAPGVRAIRSLGELAGAVTA